MIIQSMIQWLEDQAIEFSLISDETVRIGEENYLMLERESGVRVFDDDFNLMLIDEEFKIIKEHQCTQVLFFFGPYLYFTSVEEDTLIQRVSSIGKCTHNLEMVLPRLGIHTGYELLSAQGMPLDFVKRAKFLGVDTLGIADYNSLAGSLEFQKICLSNQIHPIIGATLKINRQYIQCYVKDLVGWSNLSRLISEVKFSDHDLAADRLVALSKGLVVVLSHFYSDEDLDYLLANCDDAVIGLDLTEWSSVEKDNLSIKGIINVLENYLHVKLVWTHSVRCISKEDQNALTAITAMGGQYIPKAVDPWLKSDLELVNKLTELFKSQDDADVFLEKLMEDTIELAQSCKSFRLDTSRKLPVYFFSESEKKTSGASSSDELLLELLEEKLLELSVNKKIDINLYRQRLEKEFNVISNAGVTDYFLIVYDMCKWCHENDILIGAGRGSAAGSLSSFLLRVVKMDPIEHNLLFERFLNEGRAKTSLPDIDIDIQDDKRAQVRDYLREKYGHYRIANIGTYQEFKLRSALTDALKFAGAPWDKVKDATSSIPKEYESGGFNDLIKVAIGNEKLRDTLVSYPKWIEYLEAILGQPRSSGIHASAVVIVPKDQTHEDFFDWSPVSKIDGVLVTQFQGTDLDDLGFLKVDLLGLSQLTKFQQMIKLINQNTNDNLKSSDIFNIPHNDLNVYEYFHEGLNEDVFQFGSPSQIQYSKYLKPDSLAELTAANALYRPGPMDSGAHESFVEIKFKRQDIKPYPLLEDIFEDTYGLMCFQEQIMAAFTRIADADLNQADNFRKFVTKLKGAYLTDDKFIEYMDLFVNGYVRKGVDQVIAEDIWQQLIAFTKYSFNKSHALCYAYIGYVSQWFKVYYPFEFWAVSLTYSDSDLITRKIREIKKLELVKVSQPDINYSGIAFNSDKKTNSIYWSLLSIKGLGEKTLQKLVDEREENGHFTSLEDFLIRSKKKVAKGIVYSLIKVGAFDQVEDVKHIGNRAKLLSRACQEYGDQMMKIESSHFSEWYWHMESFKICKFHNLEIDQVKPLLNDDLKRCFFLTSNDLIDHGKHFEVNKQPIVLCGILASVTKRITKTGKTILHLVIDQSGDLINCVFWGAPALKWNGKLSVGQLVAMSGKVSYDTFREQHSVYSEYYTEVQVLA